MLAKVLVIVTLITTISIQLTLQQSGCNGLAKDLGGSWQCIYALGLLYTAYQLKDDRQCPTKTDLYNCFDEVKLAMQGYYSGGCHCDNSVRNAAFSMVSADYVNPAFQPTPTSQPGSQVAGAFSQGFLADPVRRKLEQAETVHYYKYCQQQYYSAFTEVFGVPLYNSASGRCPDAGQARINLRPNVPQANPPVIRDNAVPIRVLPGVLLPQAWVDAGVAKDTREARLKNISDGIQIDTIPQNMADYDREGPQEISAATTYFINSIVAFTLVIITVIVLI